MYLSKLCMYCYYKPHSPPSISLPLLPLPSSSIPTGNTQICLDKGWIYSTRLSWLTKITYILGSPINFPPISPTPPCSIPAVYAIHYPSSSPSFFSEPPESLVPSHRLPIPFPSPPFPTPSPSRHPPTFSPSHPLFWLYMYVYIVGKCTAPWTVTIRFYYPSQGLQIRKTLDDALIWVPEVLGCAKQSLKKDCFVYLSTHSPVFLL